MLMIKQCPLAQHSHLPARAVVGEHIFKLLTLKVHETKFITEPVK